MNVMHPFRKLFFAFIPNSYATLEANTILYDFIVIAYSIQAFRLPLYNSSIKH